MSPSEFWRQADQFLGSQALINALRSTLAAALFNTKKGTVVGCTQSMVQLFGYDSESELIGRSLDLLIPEQYRDAPKALQMGERKLPGLRRDGTVFTMSIWLIPVGPDEVLTLFFD